MQVPALHALSGCAAIPLAAEAEPSPVPFLLQHFESVKYVHGIAVIPLSIAEYAVQSGSVHFHHLLRRFQSSAVPLEFLATRCSSVPIVSRASPVAPVPESFSRSAESTVPVPESYFPEF